MTVPYERVNARGTLRCLATQLGALLKLAESTEVQTRLGGAVSHLGIYFIMLPTAALRSSQNGGMVNVR